VHGDAVEADLAFRQIDFRDLWRRGSGLTLRRLFVLLRGLPYESAFKAEMRAAYERSLKPTPEQIRARQEHYRRKAEGAQ